MNEVFAHNMCCDYFEYIQANVLILLSHLLDDTNELYGMLHAFHMPCHDYTLFSHVMLSSQVVY